MADLPHDPDSHSDPGDDAGMPRWVKVCGIIFVAVALLFIIVHLAGGGFPHTLMMTPGLRRFALTAHVVSSVGWLGAVAGFLALAVAGLTSRDVQMVRAAYLAMDFTGWFVIVPLSVASPVTGLVQSLGTTWGLFRHYWVLIKFLITVPATGLLLVHMRPVGHLARVVAETTLYSGQLAGMRIQLLADAGAALVVLLLATTLSIYKPKGMTRYGRRTLRNQ